LGCQETSKVEVPLLHIHQRCRTSLFIEFSILGERFHPGALWNHFQFFDFLGYFITKSERRGKVWNISSSCARCTILFGIVSLLEPEETLQSRSAGKLHGTAAFLLCSERGQWSSDWHAQNDLQHCRAIGITSVRVAVDCTR